jgi:hypothetical protein
MSLERGVFDASCLTRVRVVSWTTGFSGPHRDETGRDHTAPQAYTAGVPHVRTSVRGSGKTGRSPIKGMSFSLCFTREPRYPTSPMSQVVWWTTGFAGPHGDETGRDHSAPQAHTEGVPHVRTSVRGSGKTGRSPIKGLSFSLCPTEELGCPISRSFFARCGSTATLPFDCCGIDQFRNRQIQLPPTQIASRKANEHVSIG